MAENEDCEEVKNKSGTSKLIGGAAEISGGKYNPVESMNIGEGFGDTPIKLCDD